MNDRNRNASNDWIRDHMPDPDEFSLEDNEKEGDTQKYFFLRYRDSAMVIFLVAVQDGKVKSVKKEVSQMGAGHSETKNASQSS